MKTLRFGIIGTNGISDKVIAGGREDARFQPVAVCSRTAERAAAFADKHALSLTFTDAEAMAASPDIDAVYIATPNACHAEQAIRFMRHGKHVLCEKAFASNAREAREMIATAKATGVTLMEAMKPTLTPNFLRLRETIGRVGAVRRYFSCYCQYSSRYDDFKAGVIQNAFKPELSNGALVDIGVYTIYPMVVLFGRPTSVKATGRLLSTGVDGAGSVLFTYPEMDAAVLYSKISNSALPTEIQGEAGTLTLDRVNIIGSVSLRLREGETENIGAPHQHHEYFYEVKEFIDLVEDGRQQSAVNSWDNTLITMELMDEIRRQTGVVFPADLNPADDGRR
jgi:predicted dehydrogenase